MRTHRFWIPMGLLALLAACGGEAPSADVSGEPTEVTYAPALEVSLDEMSRTASGLYLRDVVPGEGATAAAGNDVSVHYTGWLPNGEEFDSSRAGLPFTFTLGAGSVIAGWDEGVQGMQVGGRRTLVIPPSLGYGESGAGGVIPPNATLVFGVELLEVR